MRADRLNIRIEIEHAAQPADDREKRAQLRQPDRRHQAIFATRDLDAAGCPVQRDHAAVSAMLDHFHTGDRTGGEERQDRVPIVWRTIAEAQSYKRWL